MTQIELRPASFDLTFTAREKLAGLIGDQAVPLAAVRAVEVVPDGAAALRGVRAPGFAIPRVRMIGTWRRRSGRTLADVRAHQPAVRIALTGHRYDELLVRVSDPERTAAALAAAARAAA